MPNVREQNTDQLIARLASLTHGDSEGREAGEIIHELERRGFAVRFSAAGRVEVV